MSDRRVLYGQSFHLHGDSPHGAYRNAELTQNIRFDALLRHIEPFFLKGSTIHDIGSGLCNLYEFLSVNRGLGHMTYSASEIVPEMVDLSRQKFPGITIDNRNFLAEAVTDRYDFIVLSGALNSQGETEASNWKVMSLALIEKMFLQADKAISFNFLTSYRTFSDPSLHCFDPREMFDFAMTHLSRFVTIDAAYPLHESTITVFKKDFVASRHAESELAKYFR
jgi:hypothetical protein